MPEIVLSRDYTSHGKIYLKGKQNVPDKVFESLTKREAHYAAKAQEETAPVLAENETKDEEVDEEQEEFKKAVKELAKMNKDDLLALAKEEEVEVEEGAKKEVIANAIQLKRSSANPTE